MRRDAIAPACPRTSRPIAPWPPEQVLPRRQPQSVPGGRLIGLSQACAALGARKQVCPDAGGEIRGRWPSCPIGQIKHHRPEPDDGATATQSVGPFQFGAPHILLEPPASIGRPGERQNVWRLSSRAVLFNALVALGVPALASGAPAAEEEGDQQTV